MKEQGTSTIHLPVTLTQEDIELTINQLIKGTIYEDNDMDKDGLMVRAEKKEPISLEIKPTSIQYRVPLGIWLKKDIGLTEVEGDGSIAILLSSTYEITEDWKIKTNTEVLSHEWLVKPKVKLGFLDIPIKFIADKIIQRSRELITTSLDQQVALKFNLRDYIQKGWDALKEPIRASKDFDFWIKIQASDLSMTPLEVKDKVISSKVSIKARTNLILDEKPLPQELIPLPTFKYGETSTQDQFLVQLGATASYEKIEQLARKFLLGKEYNIAGQMIKIENLKLLGEKDKVSIDVGLSGAYVGRLFLSGQPVFDADKNQIEVENLSFELTTKNIFMKGMTWLFQSKLETALKKALKISLTEQVDKVKKLAQKHLENYQVKEQIFLKGKLEEIELYKMELTASHIEALFLFGGKLKMSIQAPS